MGDMASEEVRWLSETEQVSWRAYLRANRELDVALDRDLQAVGISLSEYELLSMLSEAPTVAQGIRDFATACRARPEDVRGRVIRWGRVAAPQPTPE